jgi:hypothetical protein
MCTKDLHERTADELSIALDYCLLKRNELIEFKKDSVTFVEEYNDLTNEINLLVNELTIKS